MKQDMGLQALVNGLSAGWQKERAKTQMTLGKLIAVLESLPTDTPVANLFDFDSYRGYYEDLALSLGEGTRQAGELLTDCRECMGEVFCGYKGGEYMMGATTPLWVADYGRCGVKLMAVNPDGTIETAEDD